MHFITQSVLLKALGWSLLNSLWQMAFLWLIYLVITGTGSRFSARVKHNMALLLSLVGTCWFLYGFMANLFDHDLLSAKSAAIILTGSFSNMVLQIKKMLIAVLPYLSFIYLGTLLFLSSRYIQYYLRLRQIKLTGLYKIQPALRLFADNVSRQIGIHKKVAVWLSSVVDSPMTIGFLKPIILIPIATVNHLTTEQVETILLHELTHIKRNDYLVNFFVTISGIIFFFNPFAKLFIHTIKKERENCCDDLVIQFQYNPHTYASALLSLERTRHRHQQLAMTAIGKSNKLLLERVKRVTGHKYTARQYSLAMIGSFLFAIAIACIAVINPEQQHLPMQAIFPNQIKQAATKDFQQASFVFTVAPIKEKTRKPVKTKSKPEIKQEENDYVGPNVFAVSQNETEDMVEANNFITAAAPPEPRDYTISSSPAIAGPPVNTNGYPYVPSSSFIFQETDDSARQANNNMTYYEIVSNESMQKTLHALDRINWSKIEKEIDKDGSLKNIAQIQNEIRKSLANIDVKKAGEDIALSCSKADEKRARENIKMQLQVLHYFKIKNQLNPHIAEQGLLQQQGLKKQLETIRKSQEILKKRITRIIYI